MSPDRRHETARIYQFPIKPRRVSEAGRLSTSTIDERSQAPATDFGSGWYHDAAIKNDPGRPHAG